MTDWSREIMLARERIQRAAEHANIDDDVDRIGMAAMLMERAFFADMIEATLQPGDARDQLLDLVRQLDEASAPEVARLFPENP